MTRIAFAAIEILAAADKRQLWRGVVACTLSLLPLNFFGLFILDMPRCITKKVVIVASTQYGRVWS
jgi:hypothetical protein